MGVQSFDDEIIKLSSRKHTSKQAISSIETIQDVGGFKLNIDLLSGLTGKNMKSWTHSLETAIKQDVDMLTIYKMKTYSNTAFFKKAVHDNQIILPSDINEVEFMQKALELVFSNGYQMWSTFAFTKNKSQSVYIENTWRGHDMIAYGSSSFGKVGNFNYQNLNNIKSYSEKIMNDELPIYRSYNLTVKDALIKEILLCSVRLASYKRIDFTRKFRFDYTALIPDVIDELFRKGYITDNRQEIV